MSSSNPKQASALLYFQGFSIAIFSLAAIFTFIEINKHLFLQSGIVMFVLQVVAAFFIAMIAADFVSGFVHFLFDNFGDEHTPFFGQHFIKPFRDHHGDPQEITRHNFLDTNGTNFLAAAPLMIMLLLWLLMKPEGKEINIIAVFALWFFLIASAFTNQFHKWAHTIQRPAFVKFLQKTHLILPFNHHTVHHSYNYDKYYCITTGWLNPLLTKIGFFEGILKIFR